MKTLLFFFKLNDIKKITIDNSVRFIPKSEQTNERDMKPKQKQLKLVHFLVNKTKIFHRLVNNSSKM